ncbi:HD domain-containing phosphohydrolase [Roseixanthobacter pseudopolyaromaticivorans]|uniref:HD domain-containing phosphohydrolase n=1 Tax=Xanthobacteraceae TaxID=335928 RepID=UPI0037264431
MTSIAPITPSKVRTRLFARRTLPLQLLIALVVVCSMATLGAVLMWQGWQVARAALLTSASDTAQNLGKLINEKSRRILGPAGATLRYLSYDPLSASDDLPQRLDRLQVLTSTLEHIPFVSAVYAGYPNGEFFLVRSVDDAHLTRLFDAPPGTAFLVQSITLDTNGQPIGEWRFYDSQLHLLKSEMKPDYKYDPRSRPWYKNAPRDGSEYLTNPYIFFTTEDIGVTLSRRSQDGGAVIGLDVAVSDLHNELRDFRPTPRSEIAVVDHDGMVIAYSNFERTLLRNGTDVQFKQLFALGVDALTALGGPSTSSAFSKVYIADGETWFGASIALDALPGRNLRLLMATPDSDLLATIRAGLKRQLWWTLALTGLLLLAGWFAGRRLGLSLASLTRQAQHITRFDFRQPEPVQSVVREIRDLENVLRDICVTIQNFLLTTETISTETKLDQMLQTVLGRTLEITGCVFGAVYLANEKNTGLQLAATAGWAAHHEMNGSLPGELPLPGPHDVASVIGTLMPGMGQFALTLRNRQQRPVGLLLLDHPLNEAHGADFRAFAEKLSSVLAVAIETRQLIEAQKALLDAIIRVMADAIDAKSPYTGGHCERVPQLATMIVDRMMAESSGPFESFRPTEDERYAFHLGAWLHDCGKVTSPEHVIDKATKLETIFNRIHEVRTRFEVLWRDAELRHLRRLLDGTPEAESEAQLRTEHVRLQDDFAFIATCNVGGEFMTDEAIERLNSIARQTWMRHFDNRLGLSAEETRRMSACPAEKLPVTEPLLCDRPEHLVPWHGRKPPVEKDDPHNIYGFDMKLPVHQQHLGELHNLSIRRGTLSEEERFKVNDHIVQTYIMLLSLPWPAHLRRVPEIAATHHERLDGKGYPRRLGGAQLSLMDRVMALADVFEALTASDRPYKPQKTLTESLRIIAAMCREGHLDTEVFRYFITSRLWEAYALRFLQPHQRDAVDTAAILALLGPPPEGEGATKTQGSIAQ